MLIKGFRIGYRKVDLVGMSSYGILSIHRFSTSNPLLGVIVEKVDRI